MELAWFGMVLTSWDDLDCFDPWTVARQLDKPELENLIFVRPSSGLLPVSVPGASIYECCLLAHKANPQMNKKYKPNGQSVQSMGWPWPSVLGR